MQQCVLLLAIIKTLSFVVRKTKQFGQISENFATAFKNIISV